MTRTDVGATAEDIAEAFFRSEGFVVHRVPRSGAKSPDFEVDGDEPGYLVEVKARFDDDAFDEVAAGEVFTADQSLHWSMGVYRQAKKAVAQMRQRDPEHRRIWILWYAAAASVADDLATEQIRGTLLGIRQVVDLADVGAGTRALLYAQRGVFEQLPDLDAAIIAPRAEMWANELGRLDAVLKTRLADLFREHGGVNVGRDHAAAGRALMLAGGRGARTDADVLAYLRKECGVRLPQVLHFRNYVALASVTPTPEASDR